MLGKLSLCVLCFAVLAICASSPGAQTPPETREDWESDLRLREEALKTAQKDVELWQRFVQSLPDEARLMEDKKLLEEVKGDLVGQIQSLAELEKQASGMRKMADETESELKAWEERLQADREALAKAQKTWDEKMKKILLPNDLPEKYRKKFVGTQLGPLRWQKERTIATYKEQLNALGPDQRKNLQEQLSRLEEELKEINEAIDSLEETQELNAKKLALQAAETAIENLRKVTKRLKDVERQASAHTSEARSQIEGHIAAIRPKGPAAGGGIVGGLDAVLRAMEGASTGVPGTGQPKSAQELEQEVRSLIDPKLAELDKQIEEARRSRKSLAESQERLAQAEVAWQKAKRDTVEPAINQPLEPKQISIGLHTAMKDALVKVYGQVDWDTVAVLQSVETFAGNEYVKMVKDLGVGVIATFVRVPHLEGRADLVRRLVGWGLALGTAEKPIEEVPHIFLKQLLGTAAKRYFPGGPITGIARKEAIHWTDKGFKKALADLENSGLYMQDFEQAPLKSKAGYSIGKTRGTLTYSPITGRVLVLASGGTEKGVDAENPRRLMISYQANAYGMPQTDTLQLWRIRADGTEERLP